MKRTEESGITLIVLAITVIVMLILSAIAINAAIGDGGLIGRAEDAANRYDRVENEELAYMNGMSHRYDNVIDNASAVRPSIKDIKVTTKDRSATLVVTATNVEYYRYYYKKASENNYTLLSEQNGNTYTIDGLELEEKYNVKVEAINGEKKAEREITISIGDVISAEGNIKFGNLVWSNKKASVTMSTTSNYTIQYQVNGENEGAWITGNKAENLNLNDVVYVRLWNGSKGGKSTSLTVTEITPPTVHISIGQVTTNSIQVTASAQDNESGMPDNPEYEFYIKRSTDGNFPTNPNYRGTNAYYTFTGLANGTNYDIKVVTRDNAGNQGNNISYNNRTVAITGEGGEISFGAIEWQSDHTARVTISTTTTYTIQYQVNGTSEGNWTTGTVASNLRLNDRLYARLWDGTSSGGMIDTLISDTVIPNVADIQMAKTANVSQTITATVKQSDSQSGVNIGSCRWVYNTVSGNVGTNANSYTGGSFASENDTVQLTATSPGTYYLHVLTVDNAGQARETKAGPVTVSRLATGLTLDQDNLQLTIGDMRAITAEVTPSDASNKGVTWSSDNEAVATVVDGIVTAVGKGTATITATTTDGSGISASCNVTVDTYVDATVVLGTGRIPTWTSASVFRRSETPYDANDPDNLSGQYGTISSTGSYGVETWVDVDGVQWWYCKAKTVQLPAKTGQVFYSMLYNNTIQEVYLNEFDTSGVTNLHYSAKSGSTYNNFCLFYYYSVYAGKVSSTRSWSNLKKVHVDGCDFSGITDLSYAFTETSIEEMDFSVLKDGGSTTRNVTNLSYMFQGCAQLKKVNFGSLNTQSVTDISRMFLDATLLQTVNMSSFNTISCKYFNYLFSGCTSLQNVIVSSKFTNNAATDLNYIFENVPTSFNKDCLGWTNGTWNSSGTFTKN